LGLWPEARAGANLRSKNDTQGEQMRHLRTLTAFAATASLALAAAPSAFASTSGVGNSNGTPT
jgi:hypothetical protein